MSFEDQSNALVFFHHEQHAFEKHLVQALKENLSARGDIVFQKYNEKKVF
jgi:hypothetical protein